MIACKNCGMSSVLSIHLQHTCMHLMRVFRGVCLEIMDRDNDTKFEASTLVDPNQPNAFSALERIYKLAKGLVKQYGNVRVVNAEASNRPKGKHFSIHNLSVNSHNLMQVTRTIRGRRSISTPAKKR
jgi:hypothetical protein